MSDSVRPHKWQPTRLSCPWDSPGKNTEVGCHFLLHCMKVKSESEVAQSCPTLSDPMECSLPGSSVHGIFQARVLEWVAIAFSVKVLLAWGFFSTEAWSVRKCFAIYSKLSKHCIMCVCHVKIANDKKCLCVLKILLFLL